MLACVFSFPLLRNPLSIGLVLLVITLLVAVSLGTVFSYLWLSYTLVLILLGGLLVIFIYVALVASNENFSSSNFFFVVGGVVRILGRLLIYQNSSSFRTSETQRSFFTLNQEGLEWVFSFYSYELNLLTVFLLLYLFLTLIVVVFNTKDNKITLRSQYR